MGPWSGDGRGELVTNGSGVASIPGVASGDAGVASGENVTAGSGVGVVVAGGGGGGSDRVQALAVVTSIKVAVAAEARTMPLISARLLP